MKLIDKILEAYPDTQAYMAYDLDEAIIGYEPNRDVFVYSIHKCITTIMNKCNIPYEEASEHFYFNTINAYVGEHTPIFIDMLEDI